MWLKDIFYKDVLGLTNQWLSIVSNITSSSLHSFNISIKNKLQGKIT